MPKTFSIRTGLLATVAAFAISNAPGDAPAFAQAPAPTGPAPAATEVTGSDAGLEEIVVTAQRRSENLQSVPIAITAISADSLAKSGITNSLQLTQVAPAIQITRSGPQTILFVRGVGNSSGAVGEEGANAWYLDGVYLGDQSSVNLYFNNIQRIEILKGPQGTLFGRNASGGLINIITRDPGDNQVLQGSFGYGNYQTYSGKLYAATPLTSNLSADIALTGSDQRDGWGKNLLTGEDAMRSWFFGVRSKAVWRPDSDTKVTTTGDFRRSTDSTGNAFPIFNGSKNLLGQTYYGDYNTDTNLPKPARIRNWGASLAIERNLGFATVTSITAHRYLHSNSASDGDSGPTPLLDINLLSSSGTFQEELRLASNAHGPLTWQGGFFYYYADAKLLHQTVTGTGVGGVGRGFDLVTSMKTNSYAGFGEATYDITRTTHLTGGVRYTIDKRDYSGIETPVNEVIPAYVAAFTIAGPNGAPITSSPTFKKFTFRAALRQEIGSNVNVYGSFNRGFKAGLFGLNSSPLFAAVGPQTTDAFDAGIKTQLLSNKLRLNLSVFHYKINGYQVRAADLSGGYAAKLLNATTVTSKGAEAEIEFAPTHALRLFGNLAYLDSRFGDFTNYPYTVPNPRTCIAGGNPPYVITGPLTGGNNSTPCIGSATGNRTPNSPKWAYDLGANYTFELKDHKQIISSLLYTYKSRNYFDASNRTSQAPYGLLNGSLEYRFSPKLGLEVWADNITNKTYYVLNLEGSVDQAGYGAPRTYGMRVNFNF